MILEVSDKEVVDHINGDGLDNRRCNLRVTSQKFNNRNARKRKKGTSIYKGVHFCEVTKKWKAQIQINKKKKSLGGYFTEKEAAEAYNEEALKLFKEFAVINNFKEAK